MKYRCFFYFTTQRTLSPCFAYADIETDGSMTKPEMKSIEEHYKEVIEKETGCEVSKFAFAAWSEIAEERKDENN